MHEKRTLTHNKLNARKVILNRNLSKTTEHAPHDRTFSSSHSLQKCHWIDEWKQDTRAQDMSLKVFPVSQFQFDFIFLFFIHFLLSISLSLFLSFCVDGNQCWRLTLRLLSVVDLPETDAACVSVCSRRGGQENCRLMWCFPVVITISNRSECESLLFCFLFFPHSCSYFFHFFRCSSEAMISTYLSN